jgi:hypothetical protein
MHTCTVKQQTKIKNAQKYFFLKIADFGSLPG